jgi:hypothetical protein
MAYVKYKRSSGSWTPLIDANNVTGHQVLSMMPTNAKINGKLGNKTKSRKKPLRVRGGWGEISFDVNVNVLALQTEDPDIPVQNFWYLPNVMIWASNPHVLTGYTLESHVTWYSRKSVGKTVSNAPVLSGEISMKVTNPLGKTTYYANPLEYRVFTNQITL